MSHLQQLDHAWSCGFADCIGSSRYSGNRIFAGSPELAAEYYYGWEAALADCAGSAGRG